MAAENGDNKSLHNKYNFSGSLTNFYSEVSQELINEKNRLFFNRDDQKIANLETKLQQIKQIKSLLNDEYKNKPIEQQIKFIKQKWADNNWMSKGNSADAKFYHQIVSIEFGRYVTNELSSHSTEDLYKDAFYFYDIVKQHIENPDENNLPTLGKHQLNQLIHLSLIEDFLPEYNEGSVEISQVRKNRIISNKYTEICDFIAECTKENSNEHEDMSSSEFESNLLQELAKLLPESFVSKVDAEPSSPNNSSSLSAQSSSDSEDLFFSDTPTVLKVKEEQLHPEVDIIRNFVDLAFKSAHDQMLKLYDLKAVGRMEKEVQRECKFNQLINNIVYDLSKCLNQSEYSSPKNKINAFEGACEKIKKQLDGLSRLKNEQYKIILIEIVSSCLNFACTKYKQEQEKTVKAEQKKKEEAQKREELEQHKTISKIKFKTLFALYQEGNLNADKSTFIRDALIGFINNHFIALYKSQEGLVTLNVFALEMMNIFDAAVIRENISSQDKNSVQKICENTISKTKEAIFALDVSVYHKELNSSQLRALGQLKLEMLEWIDEFKKTAPEQYHSTVAAEEKLKAQKAAEEENEWIENEIDDYEDLFEQLCEEIKSNKVFLTYDYLLQIKDKFNQKYDKIKNFIEDSIVISADEKLNFKNEIADVQKSVDNFIEQKMDDIHLEEQLIKLEKQEKIQQAENEKNEELRKAKAVELEAKKKVEEEAKRKIEAEVRIAQINAEANALLNAEENKKTEEAKKAAQAQEQKKSEELMKAEKESAEKQRAQQQEKQEIGNKIKILEGYIDEYAASVTAQNINPPEIQKKIENILDFKNELNIFINKTSLDDNQKNDYLERINSQIKPLEVWVEKKEAEEKRKADERARKMDEKQAAKILKQKQIMDLESFVDGLLNDSHLNEFDRLRKLNSKYVDINKPTKKLPSTYNDLKTKINNAEKKREEEQDKKERLNIEEKFFKNMTHFLVSVSGSDKRLVGVIKNSQKIITIQNLQDLLQYVLHHKAAYISNVFKAVWMKYFDQEFGSNNIQNQNLRDDLKTEFEKFSDILVNANIKNTDVLVVEYNRLLSFLDKNKNSVFLSVENMLNELRKVFPIPSNIAADRQKYLAMIKSDITDKFDAFDDNDPKQSEDKKAAQAMAKFLNDKINRFVDERKFYSTKLSSAFYDEIGQELDKVNLKPDSAPVNNNSYERLGRHRDLLGNAKENIRLALIPIVGWAMLIIKSFIRLTEKGKDFNYVSAQSVIFKFGKTKTQENLEKIGKAAKAMSERSQNVVNGNNSNKLGKI